MKDLSTHDECEEPKVFRTGVNTTLLSDTLYSIGLTESVVSRVKGFEKKPVDLCGCEKEDREDGVGTDVNVIIMSDVLYGIGLSESVSSVLTSFAIMTNSGHGSL